MLLKVLILLLLHECNAQLNVFEIDYLGNHFSVEEYKKLDVCYSKICMTDSKKIMAYASHNDSDPCLDFSNFACGHFNAYRPINDRYYTVGFENDIEVQWDDYMRRILKQKIQEDEPKIFKIVKKYYQKCVNSTFVRNDGKAEFKSLLDKFGKFPIFEDNWKPSDFNITEALISSEDELFLVVTQRFHGLSMRLAHPYYETNETIRNVLKFDFNLDEKLTSEIFNEIIQSPFRFQAFSNQDMSSIPIHELDEYCNITSGVDWLEIIKHQTKNNDINNDTLVNLFICSNGDFEIFDLKNRRKLANLFTYNLLVSKIHLFSVYPTPPHTRRSKNRYEICIEKMRTIVNFPLEIMFQLKYGNETTSKAFKDFTEKFMKIQSSVGWIENIPHVLNNRTTNATIIIGFPDELTSPEFLNELYANLNLTGDEGLYEMFLELMNYSDTIYKEGNNSISMENLTENAKEIFKNCGEKKQILFDRYLCEGPKNSIVFKVKDTLYPLFHPQRAYFVNLAYLSHTIGNFRIDTTFRYYLSELIGLSQIDLQQHYFKYVEQFGPEQNQPGFLMTNQQMLEMISYQSQCIKTQYGDIGSNKVVRKSIFNCPLEKGENDEIGGYEQFTRIKYK